jgi:hypothetical protein
MAKNRKTKTDVNLSLTEDTKIKNVNKMMEGVFVDEFRERLLQQVEQSKIIQTIGENKIAEVSDEVDKILYKHFSKYEDNYALLCIFFHANTLVMNLLAVEVMKTNKEMDDYSRK